MSEYERGVVVNESDLPDDVVMEAVSTYFEENASVLGANQGTTFQNYASDGSLLARSKFRTPANVIEEIVLARDMAERDDDVRAAMGSMLAIAFGEGMQNVHKDEITVALYNEIAKHAGLDGVFQELYREWLISGGVTTVTPFTREPIQFFPEGADRQRTRDVAVPLIGVLHAEQIRVLGNDMFGTGTLAYRPAVGKQEQWLREFFDRGTTPARKAEMRREDPLLTTMLVEQLSIRDEEPSMIDQGVDPAIGDELYRLNPRMVKRSTMPKGSWKYPRPPLTANFALLEAKRLLNLMDYALLQGGSNFLVVAKKGSDQRPAVPEEVSNLREVIKRASRTGVVIGDHRLSIEIITPDLKELLSESKRRLLGRKLVNALLRVPEYDKDAAGDGEKTRVEMIARVITSDRLALRRHVEHGPYDEAAKRNTAHFQQGAASIWFPKIILQGTQFFTDYILKMRDRGDIPRRYAVEAGGFDYDAAVQQRKREKANGDDRVMTPAAVPFSGAGGGPNDNGGGRPAGSGPNNGAPGADRRTPPAQARPTRVIQRNAGETVRAMYDEDEDLTFRVGELTYSILEQYADTKTIGRLTAFEREAAEEHGDVRREGPLTVVPVNVDEELADLKAVRLTTGLSMIVGTRTDDDALMARALCFREPEYTPLDAQETALRWGWDAEPLPAERRPEHEPQPIEEEHAAERSELAPVIHLHVETGRGGKVRRTVLRDDSGNIVASEEEPVEGDE